MLASRENRNETGSVLPTILLLIALLASISIVFASRIQLTTRSISNVVEQTRAISLLETGFAYITLNPHLLRAEEKEFIFDFNEGQASFRVSDEEGKIDLNAASFELLQSIFTVLDAPDPEAYAAYVIDYRDADKRDFLQRLSSETYPDAVGYGPKNAAFDSVDELLQIPFQSSFGVDSYFTINTRKSGFDIKQSSEKLKDLLSQNESNFLQFHHVSSRGVFRVSITVKTKGGTSLKASRIVKFN